MVSCPGDVCRGGDVLYLIPYSAGGRGTFRNTTASIINRKTRVSIKENKNMRKITKNI